MFPWHLKHLKQYLWLHLISKHKRSLPSCPRQLEWSSCWGHLWLALVSAFTPVTSEDTLKRQLYFSKELRFTHPDVQGTCVLCVLKWWTSPLCALPKTLPWGSQRQQGLHQMLILDRGKGCTDRAFRCHQRSMLPPISSLCLGLALCPENLKSFLKTFIIRKKNDSITIWKRP